MHDILSFRKIEGGCMLKRIIFVLPLVLAIIAQAYAQELFVNKDGSVRNIDTRAMTMTDGGFYLATKKELYRTDDPRSKWEEVFSLPSGENEIGCIGSSRHSLFIGTKRGLYRSQDNGRSWNNIFKTIIPDKSSVLCVAASKYNPSAILLGTERGVFLSNDDGSSWRDIGCNLKNKPIKCIAVSKDVIYAAGSDGLYSKRVAEDVWERIYVRSSLEKNSEEELADSVPVEEYDGSVNCIMFNGSRVYAGIDKKIKFSDDDGRSWKDFARGGLGGVINYILASRKTDDIYCATAKGVYKYDKDKNLWAELYKGMDRSVSTKSILFDGDGEASLWAVTDGGLYRLESGRFAADQYIDIERNLKSLKIIFDNEPTFKQLRQAALNYGDVNPDKIMKWHKESRLRALIPKVSVGYDSNRSTNSEIYTSANKDYVFVGPDDIASGLDVSVSWDLANLIWSDDQTNIDARSRLTTQLRNDILDDLRRAYYERRRLQFDLSANLPKDMKLRFEKELRIQELTQVIDDLTGNYLSEHIRSS